MGAAGTRESASPRSGARRHDGRALSGNEDEAPTLLRRLQNDIVNHRPTQSAATPREPDDSLRVFPCPSVRRELELVAAEIWALVRKDPSLRLNDIAVVVPEASKGFSIWRTSRRCYGESCDLPHSVADLPAASSHRVAEAIQLLLDLPFSSFSRRDFLPLLTHPCLMARFPKAAPERWRALTSALGIVRGADRGDFAGRLVRHARSLQLGSRAPPAGPGCASGRRRRSRAGHAEWRALSSRPSAQGWRRRYESGFRSARALPDRGRALCLWPKRRASATRMAGLRARHGRFLRRARRRRYRGQDRRRALLCGA